MSIFDGLGKFGLGNLEKSEVFAEEKKKEEEEKAAQSVVKTPEEIEVEILFDKTYKCPLCDKDFKAKTVRAGKAKLIGTDLDLRPKYESLDCVKYDVVLCPHCGYAALTRFFTTSTSAQLKLIKDQISSNYQGKESDAPYYTYDEAIERYKMTLVNTVVKKARASEKAYVCLKAAWVLRGKAETLPKDTPNYDEIVKQCQEEEKEFLLNAFEGFSAARTKESYPMCGMDEQTVDYLLAVLAMQFKKYEVASKLLGGIVTSKDANRRMKDKALDLKEILIKEMKNKA